MDSCIGREVAAVCGMVEVVHAIYPQEDGLRAVFKENILIPGCDFGHIGHTDYHHVEHDGSGDEKCPVGDDDDSEGGDDGDILGYSTDFVLQYQKLVVLLRWLQRGIVRVLNLISEPL